MPCNIVETRRRFKRLLHLLGTEVIWTKHGEKSPLHQTVLIHCVIEAHHNRHHTAVVMPIYSVWPHLIKYRQDWRAWTFPLQLSRPKIQRGHAATKHRGIYKVSLTVQSVLKIWFWGKGVKTVSCWSIWKTKQQTDFSQQASKDYQFVIFKRVCRYFVYQ